MVRGRWLERAEIDALRAALADSCAGRHGRAGGPSFADAFDRRLSGN
jgi:hypothetical protein